MIVKTLDVQPHQHSDLPLAMKPRKEDISYVINHCPPLGDCHSRAPHLQAISPLAAVESLRIPSELRTRMCIAPVLHEFTEPSAAMARCRDPDSHDDGLSSSKTRRR